VGHFWSFSLKIKKRLMKNLCPYKEGGVSISSINRSPDQCQLYFVQLTVALIDFAESVENP